MTRPIAPLRWPAGVMLAGLLAAPFLFTTIPPLTDVPGHAGRFAVQTAPSGDPLFRYFDFQWELTLNLASDVLVQLLYPVIGVLPAVRLLCALTPMLTALGLIAIARLVNARGAYALPWALVFVINFPFLWGFLNFSLTAGLALIAFAGWIALAAKPMRRAAIFLVTTPLLLVGHGVAGVTLVGLIVAYTLGQAGSLGSQRWTRELMKRLASTWSPLVAALATLVVWKALGVPGNGPTQWLLYRKGEALIMMLRDQNVLLDVGTVAAALGVAIFGWWRGAWLRGGPAAAVLFVALLFVATPSLISGSDRIDTRLAPMIPMLFFSMQDWSCVNVRSRRLVMLAGFLVLAARLGVTTASFISYDRRYALELSALNHVPSGSRVLNLTRVECVGSAWRSERLEHLAALATPFRGAWVNSHWSIGGLQLLKVRYRPSRDYYADPSQLIWPTHCVDFHEPFTRRVRHTLAESLPILPLDRVDFLWLIGEPLPPTYHDRRLRRVWSDDMSELYAINRGQER